MKKILFEEVPDDGIRDWGLDVFDTKGTGNKVVLNVDDDHRIVTVEFRIRNVHIFFAPF